MKTKKLSLLLALTIVFMSSACTAPNSQTNDTNNSVNTIASNNSWKIVHVLDDFGDKTGDVHIAGRFLGKFSNTATKDSPLGVEIIYDPNDMRGGKNYFTIRLYEYCNDTPEFYRSYDEPALKVKIGENVYEQKLDFKASETDLWLVDNGFQSAILNCYSPVFDALSNDVGDVKCVITVWKSTYNFTINGSGFASAIQELNS